MQMTEYETTLVIRPDIGGDAVETLLDKVREVVKADGKLLGISHWGKKKLAYEISKQARGIYVHTHYLGKNTLVSELERNLRISDHVLRFLTVRLASEVDGAELEEKAYERPQYDVDEPEEPEADADADESSEGSFDESHGRGRDRDRDRDRERRPAAASAHTGQSTQDDEAAPQQSAPRPSRETT
jgi:small subunit ribosomal protein S6